jgi:hypothetical protein
MVHPTDGNQRKVTDLLIFFYKGSPEIREPYHHHCPRSKLFSSAEESTNHHICGTITLLISGGPFIFRELRHTATFNISSKFTY